MLDTTSDSVRRESQQHQGTGSVRRRGASYSRRLERRAAQRAADAERAQLLVVGTGPELTGQVNDGEVRVEAEPEADQAVEAGVVREEGDLHAGIA